MPRRPLNFLTALSALLLAAWVCLSLLSCLVPAGAHVRRGGWWTGFALHEGELRVWSEMPDTPRNKKTFPYAVLKERWEWADVSVRSGARPPTHIGWEVSVPFWLTTAAFSFLPACRLGARKRRDARASARILRFRCPACGYDLRGCLTHTCPECGTDKCSLPAATG